MLIEFAVQCKSRTIQCNCCTLCFTYGPIGSTKLQFRHLITGEQVSPSHWRDQVPCIGLLRQNFYCLWVEEQSCEPSLGADEWDWLFCEVMSQNVCVAASYIFFTMFTVSFLNRIGCREVCISGFSIDFGRMHRPRHFRHFIIGTDSLEGFNPEIPPCS